MILSVSLRKADWKGIVEVPSRERVTVINVGA